MNEMLGSRIKALRSAKNFTQEQVADRIGVSRQKYARIESGASKKIFDMLDLFYANKHLCVKLQHKEMI